MRYYRESGFVAITYFLGLVRTQKFSKKIWTFGKIMADILRKLLVVGASKWRCKIQLFYIYSVWDGGGPDKIEVSYITISR